MKTPDRLVAKIFIIDGKMAGSTVEEPLPTGTYYLYAAPTPPATIAWPYECEELCKAAEQFQRAVNELWKTQNPDELLDCDTAMSEEEALELHDESWKALQSAIYYMRKRMVTPPAQGDEPVAYIVAHRDDPSEQPVLLGKHELAPYIEDNWEITASLYTRPQSDKLREANQRYTQLRIAFGKYVAGYRPGNELWAPEDQEALDLVQTGGK